MEKQLNKFNTSSSREEIDYLNETLRNSTLDNKTKSLLKELLVDFRKLTPRIWENEIKIFNLIKKSFNFLLILLCLLSSLISFLTSL